MKFEKVFSESSIVDTLSDVLDEDEIVTEETLKTITQLVLNDASDLRELTAFENLTSLHLYDCQCDSYAPLSKLTKLKELCMLGCNVDQIDFLNELTQLEDLSISDSKVQDLSPLSSLSKLKKLDLSLNEITDIFPLSSLVDLREVDLSLNPIKHIQPLLHKSKLKTLKIDTAPLEDKALLADKSIYSALYSRVDYPETFPKEWAQQQKKKLCRPKVNVLADIHSRVHFCSDAVLVSLKDGMNRIVSRKDTSKQAQEDSFELFFDEKELVNFDVESCPTCASFLHNGYGDGIMSMGECEAVRDKINGSYTNLHDAVTNMAPILGLFKSGLYVVAEYELFPWNDDFFWNGSERISQKYRYNNCMVANSAEIEYTDSPMYLYPTQRAERLNPERVEHYMSRIDASETFPCAIAMYLAGNIALLLDGHHKATAAALAGKPVKTLVIFKVDKEKELLNEVDAGTRLYLRHGKSVDQRGDLNIVKKGDVVLGLMRGVDHWEKERVFAGAVMDHPDWGLIPEEYQGNRSSYPSDGLLYYGTLIPPDQIKETFSKVYEDNSLKTHAYCLQSFAKLFPDSKFLSESQRNWLANYDEIYKKRYY